MTKYDKIFAGQGNQSEAEQNILAGPKIQLEIAKIVFVKILRAKPSWSGLGKNHR